MEKDVASRVNGNMANANHNSLFVRPDFRNYKAATNLDMNEKILQRIENGEQIYHMAFGQSPFPVYEKAVAALQMKAGENAYLPVVGIKELRNAIASFHEKVDYVKGISADDIIVGPGTKQLSFLLFAVFDGDIYLPSPSWTTYLPQSVLAHHKPIAINTTMENKWKIKASDLEKQFSENKQRNKLLVLINPDNPTGTVYTSDENKAIAEVCKKHDAIVLADEIYSLLNYQERHESIYQYYQEGTILQNGLSKWASAGGWRLGYLIFPRHLSSLKSAVRGAGSHTYSCACAPIQYAALEYFKYDSDCAVYVAHCRRILKALSEYIHCELTSVGVKIVLPMGGFYMMPDFELLRPALEKQGISSGLQMQNKLLEEIGVSLLACGPAFLRPETELTFRLCYINFDGKIALEASRELGMDTEISDDFLKLYCSNTLEGVNRLKQWTLQQLERN